MQEASLQGFLRTILIILVVYYGLKIVGRYMFPVLFKKMVKNFENKVKEQQGYQQPYDKTKEGETVIDKKPNFQSKGNDKVGEYVDFEEVED